MQGTKSKLNGGLLDHYRYFDMTLIFAYLINGTPIMMIAAPFVATAQDLDHPHTCPSFYIDAASLNRTLPF